MRLEDIEESELQQQGLGCGAAFVPSPVRYPAQDLSASAEMLIQMFGRVPDAQSQGLHRLHQQLKAQQRAAQAEMQRYQKLVEEAALKAQQQAAQQYAFFSSPPPVPPLQPAPPEPVKAEIIEAQAIPPCFTRNLKRVRGEVIQ